jgi:hypothetical protein
MRKLLVVLLLAIAVTAGAGEVPLGAGCQITSNGSVGSSASDTDCVWSSGDWLKVQCDQPIYYRADGTSPTSTSPKINFPGEPYPVRAFSDSTAQPLKILNVSAAATCNVFKDDGRL